GSCQWTWPSSLPNARPHAPFTFISKLQKHSRLTERDLEYAGHQRASGQCALASREPPPDQACGSSRDGEDRYEERDLVSQRVSGARDPDPQVERSTDQPNGNEVSRSGRQRRRGAAAQQAPQEERPQKHESS